MGVELSPLDPFQLQRAGVVGLASDRGGRTSHTAILAQALGLPLRRRASRSCRLGSSQETPSSSTGAGARSSSIPIERTRHTYQRWRRTKRAHLEDLKSLRSLPADDGRRRPDPSGGQHRVSARDSDRPRRRRRIAGAVPDRVPLSRADRSAAARKSSTGTRWRSIRALGGRQVTFRTFDLGGDKLPAGISRPRRSQSRARYPLHSLLTLAAGHLSHPAARPLPGGGGGTHAHHLPHDLRGVGAGRGAAGSATRSVPSWPGKDWLTTRKHSWAS